MNSTFTHLVLHLGAWAAAVEEARRTEDSLRWVAVPAAGTHCHKAGIPGWAEDRRDACTRPAAVDRSQGIRDAGRAEGGLRAKTAAAGKTEACLATAGGRE